MDISEDKKLGHIDVTFYRDAEGLYREVNEHIMCSYMGMTDDYLVLYDDNGRMLRLLDSRNIASITPHYHDVAGGAH